MENNEKAYYEKVDIDNELKLRKQLAALPPYCKQYFIAIESKTQSRTRLAYAYDLSCFFDYLHENNPVCKKMSITEIPLSILESLKPMDLEEYLYILKVYENTIDFMYIRDIAAYRNVRLRKNSGASYECCVYLGR